MSLSLSIVLKKILAKNCHTTLGVFVAHANAVHNSVAFSFDFFVKKSID